MIGQQTFLLDKWPRPMKFDQRHQTPFLSLRAWESGDETSLRCLAHARECIIIPRLKSLFHVACFLRRASSLRVSDFPFHHDLS